MSAAIVLSDDNHLRALNREFAGIDAATDVLSFPAGDAAPASPPGEAPHAGDVIISLERAAAQAAAGGHSLEAEVELLTVHGVLHLCGHDHAAPADSTRMWRAQAAILNSIGSDITGPAV